MTDRMQLRPRITTRVRRHLATGLRRLGHALGVEHPTLDDLHLVLTIPKTGTYSLLALAQRLHPNGDVRSANHRLVFHIDEFSDEDDTGTRDFIVNRGWETGRVSERVAVHQRLRRRAQASRSVQPRPISLLVATREPVGRFISGVYFRRWSVQRSTTLDDMRKLVFDPRPLAIIKSGRWWDLDLWFDHQVKAHFGIDVFAEPFDVERGWQIYEGEDARMLLIRQESFARLPQAIAAFYGLSSVPAEVPHENAGKDHGYEAAYREAKATIKLPDSILDEAYGTRYARHFYSDAELQAFKRRWAEQ
jgi:hypothetical protein